MKFTATYPLDAPAAPEVFHRPETLAAFAGAAEEAGFDAIAVTDHPAPSRRWLDAGGHAAFDPFAALAFCAAVTTRVRLMTYLAVLPYRNPFLTAKGAATVDALSNGRLIMAAGTGYMKSEFAALGVPFEERNERFDEAVEVMRGVWTDGDYHYTGPRFTASGQAAVPRPVQAGGPPLWIGGNSRASRRRVAQYAQGWAPMLMDDPRMAATTRTKALTTPEELKEAVGELYSFLQEAGRGPDEVDVQIQSGSVQVDGFDASAQLDRVRVLADAGATWLSLSPDPADLGACVESMRLYGKAVIEPNQA